MKIKKIHLIVLYAESLKEIQKNTHLYVDIQRVPFVLKNGKKFEIHVHFAEEKEKRLLS